MSNKVYNSTAADWTAQQVAAAADGEWQLAPDLDWRASGLCIFQTTFKSGNLAVLKNGDGRGMSPKALLDLPERPSGLIANFETDVPLSGVPVLRVHDISQSVLAMGAYARSQMQGRVFGVTGSAGKTTTTAMLSHALSAWGPVPTSSHNANLSYGVAWNLASMSWNAANIVLEMAVGRMGVTARIARPDVGIFTNIAPAHLGENSTTEDIARTKSAMFIGMNPGKTAVLNRDMLHYDIIREFADRRKLRTILYGITDRTDCRLLNYDPVDQIVTARIHGERMQYPIAAAGEHMAINSLAVIAAGTAADLPVARIVEKIANFAPLPGRGEQFDLTFGRHSITVIDDAYNANPVSMAAALANLSSKPASRRIAVLGEMADLGSDTELYHTDLATSAGESKIDQFYVIGSNYADFWSRLPAHKRGSFVRSVDELKSCLLENIRGGDIILIKASNSKKLHLLVSWLKSKAVPQKTTR